MYICHGPNYYIRGVIMLCIIFEYLHSKVSSYILFTSALILRLYRSASLLTCFTRQSILYRDLKPENLLLER